MTATDVERDRLRAALVNIRAHHYHDDHGMCRCGQLWPCVDRDLADEALRVPQQRGTEQ